MDLEFLNDPQDRIICSIGAKGSGKSFLLMNYIKYSLLHNKFDQYHLILPCFMNERDGQYEFLMAYKNITIYTGYSPGISEIVASINDNDKVKYDDKPRIFYCIDDSTSESVSIKTDQEILRISTTSRHLRTTFWLIAHSCRSILATAFRANIDYLFIFKCNTLPLIKSIYEEYFSMKKRYFKDLDAFIEFYSELILNVEHAGLFINVLKSGLDNFDPYVKEWSFMNYEYKLLSVGKHKNLNGTGKDTKAGKGQVRGPYDKFQYEGRKAGQAYSRLAGNPGK